MKASARRTFISASESMSQQTSPTTPATAQSLVAELGGATEEFRAGLATVIAGMFMSFLLGAGGLAVLFFLTRSVIQVGGKLPLYAEKGNCWLAIGLGGLLALGAAVGGAFLMRYARSLRSRWIYVCPGGLVCAGRDQAQAFPWERIACVRETVTQDYLPLKGIAKYAAPMGKSRSYSVRRDDGAYETINGDGVRKIGKLGRLLRAEADKRGIAWEVVQQSSS
jgi:hypothetical protein